MAYVIGVDLGTFNSCVAMMEDGAPLVLADRGGNETTPSVVAVTESGRRLVGRVAKRQAVTNAENTVYAAKRLIGRRFSSEQVGRMVKSVAFKIVEGPHDDPRIQLGGKAYSVPEISAIVLQEMKLIAEDYLGHEITQAVVTVPAYFNDGQRQATRDAGAIAGLDVIQIINEPTSAALAYGFGKRGNRTIAVYDLGGGTFDISLLELSGTGVFKVIATAGDTFLGGEDFDQRIIDLLMLEAEERSGLDLRRNRMAVQRVRDAAEAAKCELSTEIETEINLPFLATDDHDQPFHLTRLLNRGELEELTIDLVERTVELCETTLAEARFERSDIDDVLLVGGMTRMPAVQRAVTAFFERRATAEVDPDKVVAMGAAIQGAAMTDDQHDMVLLDVTPHTLGLVVAGGFMEELVPQNSTVPIARSKVFTTIRDNQTTVKILVEQGESRKADENELLGEFAMTGLRRARAGELEIEVTFEIDADGIVQVRAKDLDTSAEQSITITASSGLTDHELEAMVANAQEHAVQRQADSETKQLRDEVKTLINQIETLSPKVLAAVQDSDYAKQTVEQALEQVGQAKCGFAAADPDALRAQLGPLKRTLKLFEGAAASA